MAHVARWQGGRCDMRRGAMSARQEIQSAGRSAATCWCRSVPVAQASQAQELTLRTQKAEARLVDA